MHDAIVIGAGPAGNAAARCLARLGQDVLVIDRLTNIGDKLCTGIIGAECVRAFPPSEAEIHNVASSATLVSPSGRTYRIASAQPAAYIVDRVSYVASMARQAMDSGAAYRLGQRVVDIEVSDSGAVVRTEGSDGRAAHSGRVVVVASGFGSPLLQAAGLRDRSRSEYLVGAQAVVSATGLEDVEVYLGKSIAPGSFGWLVPLSGGRALAGLTSNRPLNGHMESFLSSLRSSGKVGEVVEPSRRWGIPLRTIPRTYTDRMVVVGDAAGLAKPITGGGIYYAMLSGEAAASCVHRALTAGDVSARQLRPYEQAWRARFGDELRTGYSARRLFEGLKDQHIEALLERFASPGVQDVLLGSQELSFDWHRTLVLKALRHGMLGGLLQSFAPAAAPILSRLMLSSLR